MAHAFLAEYKALYSISGTSDDAVIEAILGHVERKIRRRTGGLTLVNTSEATEVHDGDGRTPYLYTRQRPIQSITTIHQSGEEPRTYDSDSLIDSDRYGYVPDTGKFYYLGSGGAWLSGFDTVQIVYTPGYATAAAVPEDIVEALLMWSRYMHLKTERKREGVRSTNAADGSTSFEIVPIPVEVKEILDMHNPLALG